MQTFLPTQAAPAVPAAPLQIAEGEPAFPIPSDMCKAGEEAARAVARLRHRAVDNWDQVAHFTQATLAENGLSYHEQEGHTGVGASTVYRMAFGHPVGVRAVQQFAAFAACSSRQEETRAFWSGTLSRLAPKEAGAEENVTGADDKKAPVPARPEEIAALYSQLINPSSRKAVADLLHSLQAAETKR